MVYLSVTTRSRYWLKLGALLFVVGCVQIIAKADPPKPVLISETTSTRAIALDSIVFTPQPFSPTTSSLLYGSDQHTRITLFVMNLALQPGEDLSAVTAEAEDSTHRHYELKVENLRQVQGQEWMSQIALRLNENIGDVGDVLVSVAYRSVASNRVRVGMGHIGGGLPDDAGAAPTPAPPYIIKGRITSGTKGFSGIVVTLRGPQTVTTITDANGAYSLTVAAVGDYTITPSEDFYSFSPASTTFNTLSGSRSADFQAITFTISGQVKAGENKPQSGDTVTLKSSASDSWSRVASTNGGGIFSFTDLPAGYNYTVMPASSAFYAYNPQEFKNLLSDQTAIFTGTLRSYTVSGLVTDENNVPLSGNIVVLYSSNGLVAKGTSTNTDGRYSFTDVPASYNYYASPYNTQTHTFTQEGIEGLGRDNTVNFSGKRLFYTINGRIVDRSQHGVAGVNVVLSGKTNGSATTDASGNYSFGNLPAGGEYNVGVSKTDYIFEPPSRSYYLLRDEKKDFTAIRTYRITGRVTDGNGRGLIGMTMNLSGAEAGKVLTGSDGSYSFTVTTVGDYLLTPSKEQDLYTFAPANQNFKNLSDHQTANFTGAPSPVTSPTYVLEFDGSPMSVDYGLFWPVRESLGQFYWEFWAMPGENTYTKYLLSDGYGGAHALLFGFNHGPEGHYNLFGNIFDGTNANFFFSDEGPSPGEWGHYAVGWDGKNIVTYYDGVPVGKQPFAGPRISPGPDWGASLLGIGGSDHQNLIGRIAQVRGYEGNNPRANSPETSFAPQTVFSIEGQLLSYFFRPAQRVADLSSGYNNGTHPGRLRGMLSNGWIAECPECPTPRFVLDPSAPDFSNPSNPGQVNAPFSSAPATPDGSLVFDSFSRNNSTHILGGKGGLGATQGGSAGPQSWQTNLDSALPQSFGILSGHAVLLANDTALAWVSTGATNGNLDVRVDRTLGSFGSGTNTGLCFRVVDKNNFFFAYTSDDEDDPSKPRKLSIGYYQSGARTILAGGIALPTDSWKTLRTVTTQSGSISVYVGNTLVYSTSSVVFASATGAGLYNNAPALGLTNRWDNFTVLNAP